MGERRAVFYECQNVEGNVAFDRLKAVTEINGLDDSEWRVSYDDTDDLAVIVDQVGGPKSPTRLRFLRIRGDAPFVLSAARNLSPVQVEQDERITEFTHMVIFQDGFLAALTQRDAPSHKRLGNYLAEVSDQHTSIVNLYRTDVISRLKKLRKGGIKKASIKIRQSEAAKISEQKGRKGLNAIFKAGRESGSVTLGVEFSVGHFNAYLDDDFAGEIEDLAEYRDSLEQLVVSGIDENGVRDTINLKHERIASIIEYERSMSDSEIYGQMIRCRDDLKSTMGDLDNAARGG